MQSKKISELQNHKQKLQDFQRPNILDFGLVEVENPHEIQFRGMACRAVTFEVILFSILRFYSASMTFFPNIFEKVK